MRCCHGNQSKRGFQLTPRWGTHRTYCNTRCVSVSFCCDACHDLGRLAPTNVLVREPATMSAPFLMTLNQPYLYPCNACIRLQKSMSESRIHLLLSKICQSTTFSTFPLLLYCSSALEPPCKHFCTRLQYLAACVRCTHAIIDHCHHTVLK